MADAQKFYLPSNDYIFKSLLFRNPEQLRQLLACLLPDMAASLDTLRFANSELLSLNRQGKNVRLDLNVTVGQGEIVNIEMQAINDASLANRMQLYLARNYSGQAPADKEYVHLRRAISIWVCNFAFQDDTVCLRDYVLYDARNGNTFPNSIRLVVLDAPKYKYAPSPVREWLQFFSAKSEEDLMNLAATCPNMAVPCEYVRRMNMTPAERALADAYERDLLDKALIRGSAYTEGETKGRAEGEAKGRAEGEAKGRAEGEATRNIQIAKSMLAAGEPRAKILQFTELSEAELDKLL